MQKKRFHFLPVLIVVVFAVLSVFSFLLMSKVGINYNLSDYLSEETETKIGLTIMEDEFGLTGNILVMLPAIDAETATGIANSVKQMNHVTNVAFDANDPNYYKDDLALLIVMTDSDEYSAETQSVLDELRANLTADYRAELGGTAVEKEKLKNSITNEMVYILAISIGLVVIILLFTSRSFLDPIFLLGTCGIAVLLNNGTNFFFGEISYVTNSISAILQMALSIDYSIVLIDAYRRILEEENDPYVSMRKALRSVVRPVSASALTTIAGLLALLFMSFSIGFDIGLVLMKGIVLSAITALTLFPAVILLFNKPLSRTMKRPLIPSGRPFSKLARKGCYFIVPIAILLIAGSAFLQTKKDMNFADRNMDNPVITAAFGQNNNVVVLYPTTEDDREKEAELISRLEPLTRADGKKILTDYKAFANTVGEMLTRERTMEKAGISYDDANLLYAMYYLKQDPTIIRIDKRTFVPFVEELLKTDPDAAAMGDQSQINSMHLIQYVDQVMNGIYSPEAFAAKINSSGTGVYVDAFAISQVISMRYFPTNKDSAYFVRYRDMLAFLNRVVEENAFVRGMVDEETRTNLHTLVDGIARIQQLQYDPTIGAIISQTEPYASVLATQSQFYSYIDFIKATQKIVTSLAGDGTVVNVTPEQMKQIYLLYYREKGIIPSYTYYGRDIFTILLEEREKDPFIASQISPAIISQINQMRIVDNFYHWDNTQYTYQEMSSLLFNLQQSVTMGGQTTPVTEDAILGAYVKYAVFSGANLIEPINAMDLLAFLKENIDQPLLAGKITEEARRNLISNEEEASEATELFIGKNYTRMLLQVDLPNESEDTTKFVHTLEEEVRTIFGEKAHVAGEIISTDDLAKTFEYDNKLISIFTIVSIFLIVLIIFRSLSLPVILVTIIQGAIWIALATNVLTGDPIFFMSYIIATCILMGATIDYGILMSSNYVDYRHRMEKPDALRMAVNATMPTVFTSGLILTICGFVIHLISTQDSISTVGLVLAKGALCSMILITCVLPSVLYLFDGFVLKLTIGGTKKEHVIEDMDEDI